VGQTARNDADYAEIETWEHYASRFFATINVRSTCVLQVQSSNLVSSLALKDIIDVPKGDVGGCLSVTSAARRSATKHNSVAIKSA
jgi:hypothetical protein